MRGCQYLIGLLRFAATEEYYQFGMTVRLLNLTTKPQVDSLDTFKIFCAHLSIFLSDRHLASGSSGLLGWALVDLVSIPVMIAVRMVSRLYKIPFNIRYQNTYMDSVKTSITSVAATTVTIDTHL